MEDQYKLILADPPWHFRNWSGDKSGKVLHHRTRGANKHYITMKTPEICKIEIPAADDSLLLIWTLSSHLEDTFEVIKSWGFKYKAIGWIWVKTKNDGTGIRIGGGYHTRQCTEMCLIATRGKGIERVSKAEPAVLFAPRGKIHSAKPDEQYAKVARIWPDVSPKIEMFGRNLREGWDVWGNQSKSVVILPNQEEVFIEMPVAAK